MNRRLWTLAFSIAVLPSGMASATPFGAFPGPDGPNSLDVEVTVSGQMVPEGFIQLFSPTVSTLLPGTPQDVFDPINTIAPTPLVLDPATHPGGVFATSTAPVPLGVDINGDPTPGAFVSMGNAPGYVPTSVSHLNLDLLNGTSLGLTLKETGIYWVDSFNQVSHISVDQQLTFGRLDFYQTGASTFNPATAEFAVDGTIKAKDVRAVFATSPIPTERFFDLEVPLTLTGTSTTTTFLPPGPLPPSLFCFDALLTLEGETELFIPLDLGFESVEEISPGVAGITATIDNDVNVTMTLSYTIEDLVFVCVPEPGTMVLAAVGLLGLVPLVRRRMGIALR